MTPKTLSREAVPPTVVPSGDWPPVRQKTRRRTLTRRGVMWLGQTCNLRCYFCYFVDRVADAHHIEHPFMELDKAKAICTTLRRFYGNNAIDIQGGEPTIYPHILELIRHCRDIGLYPTLITNGLYLAKPGVLEKFRDAGVRDFLVSLHGIGEVHDQVVGRIKAYEKIITAIEGMRELRIPFRFNCTMSAPVVPQLPEIAQKAVDYGALAVNFIAFNPFGDQETGKRTDHNVATYASIREPLARALVLLEEHGIEANVRYLPLCMAESRHRKSFYNYQQLSYDHHEWDFNSWLWTMMQSQMMRPGDPAPPFVLGPYDRRIWHTEGTAVGDRVKKNPLVWGTAFKLQHLAGAAMRLLHGREGIYRREARLRAVLECKYRYHEGCQKCALRDICDGFHGDYAEFFGTDEARPVEGSPVHDPTAFIRDQDKIVEPEDTSWAL
jgi:MoaA/NifB/PqqE/SkfB family radical SAM enzyme